jgi:hypothetical protein
MGKKKGKVKKKKRKGGKGKGGKNKGLGGAETEELIPAFVQEYVTIHFKLVNWSFLDFSMEVCINTTKLYSLKRKITERHGRISNLRVYHGSVQPETELKDEMKTLEQLGMQGLPKQARTISTSPSGSPETSPRSTEGGSDKAEVIFWYDFKPFAHEDPLLLR